MKRWFLLLLIALSTSFCSPKSNLSNANETVKKEPYTRQNTNQRKIASVNKGIKLGPFPSTLINLLNNKKQRVKVKSTLKQFSKILPTEVFEKLINLSNKVDDLGVTIERKNSTLIFSNSKAKLKVLMTGSPANLISNINGKAYDFSDEQTALKYLNTLGKNIKSNSKYGINKRLTLPTGLFLQCLSLPFLALESQALPVGYFVAGGLIILAVAVVVSISKLGKDLKKTEHEINHRVGLNQTSEDAIRSLTQAVKEVDVDGLNNNNINVLPNVRVNQDSLGLGIQ